MRYSSSSPRSADRWTSASRTSSRKSSLRPVHSPEMAAKSLPVWKSPLLWLGLLIALLIAGINFAVWYRTVRVIAILASDVSDSGVADPTVAESICRAQTQALKPQDVAIDIAFADTTEPTHTGEVHSVTQMFPRCQHEDRQHRPPSVGKSSGTSPIVLLDRIQTQIQIQRKAGNTQPIVTVIWLQAAEPGPGLPDLDFDLLGQQIKQITDDRGRVAMIGPTGKLREDLERLSVQNPSLQVCSIAEHESCIRSTFEAARSLPARK